MLALFIGKGNSKAFCKTVINTLKKHCDFLLISEDKIIKKNSSCDLAIIFKNGNIKTALSGDCVFLNGCESGTEITGEGYLICDSRNPYDLEIAKESGGEVITCGFSLRDTVTFSSITEENCVISIQRLIRRFDGSKVEPFEIPCSLNRDDDKYAVLCANLLLILLGYL